MVCSAAGGGGAPAGEAAASEAAVSAAAAGGDGVTGCRVRSRTRGRASRATYAGERNERQRQVHGERAEPHAETHTETRAETH